MFKEPQRKVLTIKTEKKMAGMHGPNDLLGAMGYDTNHGCGSVILLLVVVGAGLLIAL